MPSLCERCTSICCSYGTDLIDHNSWKHGSEAAGGTKVLSLSSGFKDRCSFVDTVLGGAALEQYLRGAPKGTKVEAWEGRIFTCSRPVSWDVSVAEGCNVTVSAVYLPKKRPGPPAAEPLYRILFGWSRLLYTASSRIWIFRGALRGSQVLPALVSCFDWAVGALTAQLGRYSRVVVAHTRMGTDLRLGRKSRGTGSFFGVCGRRSHP